jgi:lipopolysaccharide transport system ATP-binding protein
MSSPIIVENLSKQFHRYSSEKKWTIQEAVLSGFKRDKSQDYFWALRDVNFEVPAGKMFGLIGRNGAGKSTLLRLIGGVGEPTEGKILTSGRIGALIDLGAGYHPDLTGRENIYINGVISGLLRKEVEKRFDEIVSFAELEEFIDSPFRTYSTGMQMRLAFSVVVNTDPEILLIDEVLAVGDLNFQQKCMDRINLFKEKGCTILLVTHDTNLVANLCDEALWLNKGRVAACGPTDMVVMQYTTAMQTETQKRTSESKTAKVIDDGNVLEVNKNRFGSFEMEIQDVHILNSDNLPATHLNSGEQLTIELEFCAPEIVTEPIFGITISSEDGTVCCEASASVADFGQQRVNGSGKISLEFSRLDLARGKYFVDVGIYEKEWTYAYDYHWQVYSFNIGEGNRNNSLLDPPQQWKFESYQD